MNKTVVKKKVLQMFSSVAQDLHEKNLIKSKEKLVLTISGGQDSICLLFIFCLLRLQLTIDFDLIWCNHFWQTSSFFTMSHIARCNFCCSSNIMFFVPLTKVLSEKAARDWRYKVIQRTMLFYGYNLTTQAHTKSDRTETILFNLIRGTGLSGITALKYHSIQSFFSYNKFYPFISNYVFDSHFNCLTPHFDIPTPDPHLVGVSQWGSGYRSEYPRTPLPALVSCFWRSQNQTRDIVLESKSYAFAEIKNIDLLIKFLNCSSSKNIFDYLSISTSLSFYTLLYRDLNLRPFKIFTTIDNKKLLGLLYRDNVSVKPYCIRSNHVNKRTKGIDLFRLTSSPLLGITFFLDPSCCAFVALAQQKQAKHKNRDSENTIVLLSRTTKSYEPIGLRSKTTVSKDQHYFLLLAKPKEKALNLQLIIETTNLNFNICSSLVKAKADIQNCKNYYNQLKHLTNF